jgi:hypothetical protein
VWLLPAIVVTFMSASLATMSAAARQLASRQPDAKSSSRTCPTCGQPKRTKRPRRETTDEDYRRATSRMILAYQRRIHEGGAQALADAVALRDQLDAVIAVGVADCRSEPHCASWLAIGEVTRMTRQAAQEHWAGVGGARRPCGQPSVLR